MDSKKNIKEHVNHIHDREQGIESPAIMEEEKEVKDSNKDKIEDNDKAVNAVTNIDRQEIECVLYIAGSHTSETETEDKSLIDENSNEKDQELKEANEVRENGEKKEPSSPSTSSKEQSVEKPTVNSNYITLPEITPNVSSSGSSITSAGSRTSANLYEKPNISKATSYRLNAVGVDQVRVQHERTQLELQQIEYENKELAERFKKIVDMFNNFTRNLESLEPIVQQTEDNLMAAKATNELPGCSDQSSSCNGQNISRHLNYYSELKSNARGGEQFNQSTETTEDLSRQINQQTDYSPPRKSKIGSKLKENISRSCGQSLSCQTSWHDTVNTSPLRLISHNDSVHSSRSEIPHSLNNFVSAEAAISDDRNVAASAGASSPHYHHQTAPLRANGAVSFEVAMPSTSRNRSDSRTKLFEQGGPNITITTIHSPGLNRHAHNAIQMEENSAVRPNANIPRRPPIHIRLWNVVTSFFGAFCLCLQVNRDCIFCLGFFAAFVVSASFLTAFFYRTLSVSSTTIRPLLHRGPAQEPMLMEDFNGNFRQTNRI